jgi:CxxC motif-containing protein
MTEKKEITCIICPIGCKILVDKKGNKVEITEGNKCKKGIDYATNEALDPRRLLTTSVLVENGNWPLVSVKSSRPIPKDKIFDVLKEIKKIKVKAPVKIGKIIISNVANTDIDIISTKSIKSL